MNDSGAPSPRALTGPVLIVVTVVAGAVVLVTGLRRRRASKMSAHAIERSVLAEVVRSVVLSAATVAARRLTERVLAPAPVHPISVRRGSAPGPSSHDERLRA